MDTMRRVKWGRCETKSACPARGLHCECRSIRHLLQLVQRRVHFFVAALGPVEQFWLVQMQKVYLCIAVLVVEFVLIL